MAKKRPDLIMRGNFMDDDPDDIAQQIRDYDPEGDKIILSIAAPPCPDFSQIKGEDAMGKEGPEGQKFLRYCDFAKEVDAKLPNKTFGYLVENVILQDRGEAELFSKALSSNVVAIGEGSSIHRPSAPMGQNSEADLHRRNSKEESHQTPSPGGCKIPDSLHRGNTMWKASCATPMGRCMFLLLKPRSNFTNFPRATPS